MNKFLLPVAVRWPSNNVAFATDDRAVIKAAKARLLWLTGLKSIAIGGLRSNRGICVVAKAEFRLCYHARDRATECAGEQTC
jgi:hypothetical protein